MGETNQHCGSPLVSIVIPTYNRAPLLPQAVAACLGQTYPLLEVVIVDDGSRDDTPAVCRALSESDPRVRVFRKENSGIADTLNYGFAHTRGEYLTWTSDDNAYRPQAIEKMAAYLAAHPDVGFVYADTQDVDDDGRILRVYAAAGPEALPLDCVVRGCFLYKRAVMRAVGGYDKAWRRCQDYDFYLRVHKRFAMAHFPEVLYVYRVHEASMSGDHVALVMEGGQVQAAHAGSRAQVRAIWARIFHHLARWEMTQGRGLRAVGYHLRATLQQPRHFPTFWDALWRTGYGSLPGSVKSLWRRLKRRLARLPG